MDDRKIEAVTVHDDESIFEHIQPCGARFLCRDAQQPPQLVRDPALPIEKRIDNLTSST